MPFLYFLIVKRNSKSHVLQTPRDRMKRLGKRLPKSTQKSVDVDVSLFQRALPASVTAHLTIRLYSSIINYLIMLVGFEDQ
jgi:hypothetical protein